MIETLEMSASKNKWLHQQQARKLQSRVLDCDVPAQVEHIDFISTDRTFMLSVFRVAYFIERFGNQLLLELFLNNFYVNCPISTKFQLSIVSLDSYCFYQTKFVLH